MCKRYKMSIIVLGYSILVKAKNICTVATHGKRL